MKTKYKYYYNKHNLDDNTCSFWRIDIKNTISYYKYNTHDRWCESTYSMHDVKFSGGWEELTQDEYNELLFVDYI